MQRSLDLHPGDFYLLLAPRATLVEAMAALTARLALNGDVLALDGGNCLDAYGIARGVRCHSEAFDAVLARIHVARAFTCYQVAALLRSTEPGGRPVLVLDLLATFYDEQERLGERLRLLRACLAELRRLSRQGPLVVGAWPHPEQPDPLLEALEGAVDRVWRFERTSGPPEQPRLF